MKLIVGLGNPEKQYQYTRHNAGFLCLDKIAQAQGLDWEFNKKFNSLTASKKDVLLVKPQTYMNQSGLAVAAIMNYYGLLPKKIKLFTKKDSDLTQKLLVIHDDLDLPLGRYKRSTNSRPAGHNGVASIISQLKTKNFVRLRIGISGQKPEKMPAKNYVLSRFSEEEIALLEKIFESVVKDAGDLN